MVAGVVVVIFGGMWASKQWSERERLLGNLAAHAKAHPEHAAVTQVVIGCAQRIIPDQEKCGEELLAKFGPEVLNTLGQMQEAGAFGVPLEPGKQ
tara:strand:- start:2992 stop:3276 length:285 start_codon:yes stop_codon:yes gene_type:complete